MIANIETLTRALLDLPQGLPVIIDCGGERYHVGKVTSMTGADGAAIIESGDTGLTVAGIVAGLGQVADKDGYGRKSLVELFVLSGDDYGYYNIGSVLVLEESVRLTAGAMISGSV
jgi:hypothetical protein